MSNYSDIRDFHNKFGLATEGQPAALAPIEQKFRIKCLHEELQEYENAVAQNDLPEQFDALLDLAYFALGTLHLNSLPVDHGWARVHDANMTKQLSKTGEIIKPEGWQAPDLKDLVEKAEFYDDLKNNVGLITIDGVDGSGKTTLAKRIAQLYGGEHIHLTWTPKLDLYMNSYRMSAISYAAALAKDRVVVLERPWISHPIYSHVYRNDRKKGAHGAWRALAELEQDVGILALPEDGLQWFKDYKHNTATREELYTTEDDTKMMQVYKLFWQLYDNEPSLLDVEPLDISNYIRYDYQTVNPAQNLDEWIINMTKPLLGVK